MELDKCLEDIYREVSKELCISYEDVYRCHVLYSWLIKEYIRGGDICDIVSCYGSQDGRVIVLRGLGSLVDCYGSGGLYSECMKKSYKI